MLLCRLPKVFVCTERTSLRRVLNFRNGVKSFQQHVRFVSNVQYPQNAVSDSFTTDFTAIEKVWKQNHSHGFDDFLLQCFVKENDCFSYAVHLMSQANHSAGKGSLELIVAIMHALELWQKSNGTLEQPAEQLQSKALMVALSAQNRFVVQLVCDVFRINSQCHFVEDIIENCILLKKWEEAATCVLILKMQDRYPVEKILLPICMIGKMNLAITYIGENKDLQMKVIRALDDSLQPQKPTQKEKLIYKRLCTLLSKFGMPPEMCPNLFAIHSRNTLNFLMSKRYLDKSITPSYFEEMAMVLLHDAPSLQMRLIHKLVGVKDFGTALKMASIFNIPADEWPPVLKNFEANSELPDSPPNSRGSEGVKFNRFPACTNSNDVEYLSLQLDKSCLNYVETPEQLEDCLKTISENYEIVGFDSEWKPTSNFYQSRLALMQLAVKDKVYLLDFLALGDCLKSSHWNDLIANLFGNPRILKLGCGLTTDIEVLVRNFKGPAMVPVKFSRLLDVGIFFQKFLTACPDTFSNKAEEAVKSNNTLGLSKICAYVLGIPLKKQQRFSDWEARPLDDQQLHYAALDAYCLLQIYDKLQEVAKEKDLDFEGIVDVAVMLTTESPKPACNTRRNWKWSKCDEGFQMQPLISVGEFKVLLDPKLESLGKGLKSYGVDVTFLANSTECSNAIRLAKAENRVILASSLLYEQIKASTIEIICHEISEDFTGDQSSVAYVFQKFNVKFKATDISYRDDVHTS